MRRARGVPTGLVGGSPSGDLYGRSPGWPTKPRNDIVDMGGLGATVVGADRVLVKLSGEEKKTVVATGFFGAGF